MVFTEIIYKNQPVNAEVLAENQVRNNNAIPRLAYPVGRAKRKG